MGRRNPRSSDETSPLVSVGLVARNAQNVLPDFFASMLDQTYPLSRIQLVLVDSDSDDATLSLMRSFKDENESLFFEVVLAHNPKVLLAPGCNIFLQNCTGELVLRIDAHASIPADFIEANVARIMAGESISCGKVVSVPANDTSSAAIANIAENSLFGGSIAAFRHADEPRYVDTGAFAMYKKEVFDKVGLYDERLARTEDNEMHYRMRQAGYRFFYNPTIVSQRKTRPTFGQLFKQKVQNGYWVGVTMHSAPHCFSLYHFAPMVFVIVLFLALVACVFGFPYLLIMVLLAYLIVDLVLTAAAIWGKTKCAQMAFLPLNFFILHVGYGVGTVVGLARGRWILKRR